MTDKNLPKIEYAYEHDIIVDGNALTRNGTVKFTTYDDGLHWYHQSSTKGVLFRKPKSTINIVDAYCEKLIAERFDLDLR